jgi:DeoR/GlpR family transcriptional regulator of sugar metabolism
MNAASKAVRHQLVLEILRETGKASVVDLRDRLGVTEMTIRRDLELLEADGALKRYHGGATLAIGSSYEPPFPTRERMHAGAKRAIAEWVASQIAEGSTLVVDGGSTGLAVAQALEGRSVTVCPLSLRVAWQLAKSTSIRLLIPGGAVRQGERSFVGADTIEYLLQHHFDRYVMTASGLSINGGLTEWNPDDASVKRAAARASEGVIAAIDASKYGNVGFVRICETSYPDLIVTDDSIAGPDLQDLRAHAKQVDVAGGF